MIQTTSNLLLLLVLLQKQLIGTTSCCHIVYYFNSLFYIITNVINILKTSNVMVPTSQNFKCQAVSPNDENCVVDD